MTQANGHAANYESNGQDWRAQAKLDKKRAKALSHRAQRKNGSTEPDHYFNAEAAAKTYWTLWSRTDLSLGAKTLALSLSKRIGRRGRTVWPSRLSLSAELSTPVRSMSRYLAELEKAGLMESTRRSGYVTRRKLLWL